MQPQTKDTEAHKVEQNKPEETKVEEAQTTQNQPQESKTQEKTTDKPNVDTAQSQPNKENDKKPQETHHQKKQQDKKQEVTKQKKVQTKNQTKSTQTEKKQEKKQESKEEKKTEDKKQQKTEAKKQETKKQDEKKPEVKKMMKCATLTAARTLQIKQVPIPKPASGQVLVKVMAAPINPSDLALYDGHYEHQKKFPTAMGFEGSGIVEESGGGIMGWTLVGKKVGFGAQKEGQGTYSQFVVVKAEECLPLSDDTSFEQGSMCVVNPLTALAMLDVLKSKKEKVVVLTAAASALCRMMNRIYPAEGVQIINIVRRQQQVDLLKGEGAKIILNSSDENFEKQFKQLTQKMDARTCFEAIGGEFTGLIAQNMPKNSTITVYGCLSGKNISNISPMDLIAQGKVINGFLLPQWLKSKNQITLLPTFYRVRKQISQNLKSTVSKKFKLDDVEQAIKFYLSHMTQGKVLIQPWSD